MAPLCCGSHSDARFGLNQSSYFRWSSYLRAPAALSGAGLPQFSAGYLRRMPQGDKLDQYRAEP